ncbi:dTMP kinase [Polynucleobacter cosmopolitanus]|uniref:Thymidylate kinase n=1 Tax=Polynucleobacter cosmopolitanus TaxID=351345 RepID=A0A229FT70_9BURK|nr:dTMP kinase [Polynucleobacter cosmopolitanus]OXL14619.1 dTMP kinase [Polynucleobacter cosmopolitanus]
MSLFTQSNNAPGLFISFEGIDGAGKSTHIQAFAAELAKKYPKQEIVLTREPGGTALGEKLREILLHHPMHLETEALLMFAARREHLATVIEPALAAGKIVISDRFTDASFAYQGGGRGLDLAKLYELEVWVQMRLSQDGAGKRYVLQPDLTFLFDLPSQTAESRRSAARDPDKFEQLNTDFFEKVRLEYLRRAQDDATRFHLIDASKSKEVIWKILQEAISNI